jgi:hypothetical protein
VEQEPGHEPDQRTDHRTDRSPPPHVRDLVIGSWHPSMIGPVRVPVYT